MRPILKEPGHVWQTTEHTLSTCNAVSCLTSPPCDRHLTSLPAQCRGCWSRRGLGQGRSCWLMPCPPVLPRAPPRTLL